jgi:hypothetical protein
MGQPEPIDKHQAPTLILNNCAGGSKSLSLPVAGRVALTRR